MGAASRFVGSGALLAHLPGKQQQISFIRFMCRTSNKGSPLMRTMQTQEEHSAKSPITT
jgi:hypothetical protein